MRRLLLIIVSAFGVLQAQAQQLLDLQTGSLTDGVASTVPTRDVETLPDGYRVTYTFKSALLQADDLFKGALFWKVDGFGLNPISGEPSTLGRNDMLAIPEGYTATVGVTDSAYRDYPYELTPARHPLIDSGDEVYTRENVQAIAPYEGYKPQAIVSQLPTQSYRGHDLCLVDVSPIQYSYVDKTVRAYTSITYKVTFVPKVKENTVGAEENKPKYVSPDDYFFANNVIGGEQADEAGAKSAAQDGAAKADVKDYLIVSTPKFEEAVNRFAEWQRLMGFNVHVDLRDDWTCDMVKAAVKDAYDTYPALYYLLIVGGYYDVPACVSTLNVHHITDVPYSCVDDDNISDIYCGRWPVSNVNLANGVVDKVIGYEKTPPEKYSFYETGLHCAFFQDSLRDGYEDMRFTETSEDVRAYVASQGKIQKRVYAAKSDVYPQYWGKFLSFKDPIPDELKRPNFAWNGKTVDITKAINEGAFYVLYCGHGLVDKWREPSFSNKDVNSLSNGNLLPVVFSMSCYTGKFDCDCLAQRFLSKSNGGCVAAFAATQAAYAGLTDALTGGMFDAIWPDPGLKIEIKNKYNHFSTTSAATYALGQMLNQGMTRLGETYGSGYILTNYTKEVFLCFGDPSMKIYTDVPTTFSDVSIVRGAKMVGIKLRSGEDGRITVVDPKFGKVQSFMGNSVVVQTQDPDEAIVCVSAHNRIPFVQYSDVKYIQNMNIVGKLEEMHDVIKVGNHVTDSELSGDVTTSEANVNLKARKVLLDKGTYISKGSTLRINSK